MPPSDAFDDSDDLRAPAGASDGSELVATLTSLLRAELCGTRDGAIEGAIRDALPDDRLQVLLALSDALADGALVAWIEADGMRRARSLAIVKAIAPPDPAAAHNAQVAERVASFRDWGRFPYRLLVVPGYTPPNETVAKPGVHPVARRRLELAADDLRAGKAPFVLVSGGNVHPRGTRYYEAIEMMTALCAMGVDERSIVVDARARHTTTNLRNAGRFMRAHGIPRALVVAKGGGVGGSDLFGQDFYLANPLLSTFHLRCESELGYRVGELTAAGDGRIAFEPSAAVDRVSYRDPLDP